MFFGTVPTFDVKTDNDSMVILVLFCGSGAGKSTLAHAVEKRLFAMGGRLMCWMAITSVTDCAVI